MKHIQSVLLNYPVVSSVFIVLLGIIAVTVPPIILAQLFAPDSRGFFALIARILVSFGIIFLILKLGWGEDAGITRPISEWGRKWQMAVLPMFLIGVLNLTGVDWASLRFDLSAAIFWISENLAVGLFEETIMRAFVFYILYRAWSAKPYALYWAAFAQAFIFGVVHLVNLIQAPSLAVYAQVVYATLLGIGFAGVVAYTGSIWSAVIAHAFINLVGNINRAFVPDYAAEANSLSMYIVLIAVIFCLVTLPGIWCLRQVNANQVKWGSA